MPKTGRSSGIKPAQGTPPGSSPIALRRARTKSPVSSADKPGVPDNPTAPAVGPGTPRVSSEPSPDTVPEPEAPRSSGSPKARPRAPEGPRTAWRWLHRTHPKARGTWRLASYSKIWIARDGVVEMNREPSAAEKSFFRLNGFELEEA